MVTLSYSEARARLSGLLAQAVDDRETVMITRRGAPAAALVAADELESLNETAHLLRSPANAQRLLQALEHALAHVEQRQTLADLRHEVGLGETP